MRASGDFPLRHAKLRDVISDRAPALLAAAAVAVLLTTSGCATTPSADELATRGVNLPSLSRGDGWRSFYTGSHALLLGVSDYADGSGWRDLPGVQADMQALKEGLLRHGFEVTMVDNPTRERMNRAIGDFIAAHGQPLNNRLLIWFAGHGYTIKTSWGDATGYVIPADTPSPAQDRAGFRARAVDMQMMEVHARAIDAKHALFVFDSCFAGSIFDATRAPPAHITDRTSKHVRQFIAAGGADEEVPDRSIFRQQFLAGIDGEADVDGDGFVTGAELGDHLYKSVLSYSKGTQTPQAGKIRNPRLNKGDFVFHAGGAPPADRGGARAAVASAGGFDLSDLQRESRALSETQEAIAARLLEMENAYHVAADLESGPLPNPRKAEAWARFAEHFSEDLPAVQRDDEMREEARRRHGALTGAVQERTCSYGDAADCARQCDGGHGESCLVLGKMLADGGVMDADDPAALRRFEQACDAGVAKGCVSLGWMYDKGWGAPQDLVRAEQLYRGACDAGDADGCAGLHYALELLGPDHGERTEGQVTAAVQAACEAGSGRGCANLGVRMLEGRGVDEDAIQAARRFEQACKLGFAGGCALLANQLLAGRGRAADPVQALALYQQACAGGRMSGASTGCRGLAYMYLSGTQVPEEHARARELLTRSCGDRDAGACEELSIALAQSSEAPDQQRAVELCQQACDLGLGRACFRLGKSYRRGEAGVERDRRQALELLDRACALGHGPACLMAGNMAGSPQDTARLLEAACQARTSPQCLEAGWLFEHGDGVSVDPGRALTCYSRACSLHEPAGCEGAGRLLVQADRSPEDRARGLELLQHACTSGAPAACQLAGELKP